jgi:hypothetical protein
MIDRKTKHLHAKTTKEIYKEHWGEYFTFSFVRNPWDLMVSWYVFRQKPQKLNLDFREFLTEYEIRQKWAHWLPKSLLYTDWLLQKDGTELVDFIGRFETLQQDFNTICDKIGIPRQELPHHHQTKHKHYTEYYDDETRQLVAEKYAKDIEYFGYEFGECNEVKTGSLIVHEKNT